MILSFIRKLFFHQKVYTYSYGKGLRVVQNNEDDYVPFDRSYLDGCGSIDLKGKGEGSANGGSYNGNTGGLLKGEYNYYIDNSLQFRDNSGYGCGVGDGAGLLNGKGSDA